MDNGPAAKRIRRTDTAILVPSGTSTRANPGVKLGSKLGFDNGKSNHNLRSAFKQPGSIPRPARRDGNIGVNKRYRLGEVSFGLYIEQGTKGADVSDASHSRLFDSFRRTVTSAADALCDPAPRTPRDYSGEVVPSCDGVRHWFDIVRGSIKAKQLMIGLKNVEHHKLGIPIYWVEDGAYLFPMDHTGS